jgi:predicted aspartyl protease
MSQPVTSSRYPFIRIRVTIRQPIAANQQILDLEAMIDTGFDGGVVIPKSLLDPALTPVRYLPWSLADDSELLLPAFAGIVEIGNLPSFPTVVMPLSEDTLVGRHVIDNYRVIFDHGSQVIVEP